MQQNLLIPTRRTLLAPTDTVVDMRHQRTHLLHICGLIHRVEAALMSDANAKKECNQWRAWVCTFGTSEEHHSKAKSMPSFYTTGQSTATSILHTMHRAMVVQKLLLKNQTILLDSTDSKGHLEYCQTARAFLMHRNTPIQDIGLSSAVMLFGCHIKDHLPTLWHHTTC